LAAARNQIRVLREKDRLRQFIYLLHELLAQDHFDLNLRDSLSAFRAFTKRLSLHRLLDYLFQAIFMDHMHALVQDCVCFQLFIFWSNVIFTTNAFLIFFNLDIYVDFFHPARLSLEVTGRGGRKQHVQMLSRRARESAHEPEMKQLV